MNDTNVIEIEGLAEAAKALTDARRILAFVGAGLSAASGVPVFRGPHGAYSHPSVAQWVHADTFDVKRGEMMRWYQDRREDLHRIWPNAGHYALVQLGRDRKLKVATQNVDGLVEQAASEEDVSVEVMHLHGTLSDVKCHKCGVVWPGRALDLTHENFCEQCGGPIRPAVTWFGEDLPHGPWKRASQEAERADVCLMVGTSGLVHPAATIPEAAQEAGAVLIEVNPEKTDLSSAADIVLRGAAELVLPMLLRRVDAG